MIPKYKQRMSEN